MIKKGEAINIYYSTCVIIPEYCFEYFVKKYDNKSSCLNDMDNLVNLLGADKESEDYIYCIDNKLEDNININIDDLDKTIEKNISEIKK